MVDKKKNLTEWEKKEKRRKYMREYYLRRKYQLRDGRYTRDVKKKPQENTFKITRGTFIVSFN
tara:strand:- start:353 stop:541 length:189 start_codon:yes stop_codon:yes gene_type:complete